MVIKVYISGISGNKEVKKRQQRVLMILESKNVAYEVIDITEPGKETEKEFMQLNSIAKDSKYPLPPQIFNDEDYCGDYEDFDEANEMDELEKFLKGASISTDLSENKSEIINIKQNGSTSSRETSIDKDAAPIIDKESQEQRTSLSENNKLSDANDAEIKDLTYNDDFENDKSDKTEDISEDQNNEE